VNRPPYRGRFAPSPTGPLHAGSLLAAVASWLDARACGGTWLVRIDDIDPPREVPGADLRILATLRAHALEPDEPVLYQSTRIAAYEQAIERLLREGQGFRCSCSRQELAASGGRHAAHCPSTGATEPRAAAVRVSARRLPREGHDLLLGTVDWTALDRNDSFVVWRKDGLPAYHLAVVVDDAWQGITHVIRGRDLLASTPYHLLLQEQLGHPAPAYGHLPLLLGQDGQKLSKQNLATPVDDGRPCANLLDCLHWLGQPTPPRDRSAHCGKLLDWAAAHWDRRAIPLQDQALG
jgi:glutamyl-Q tRNA(Asp) synthetase